MTDKPVVNVHLKVTSKVWPSFRVKITDSNFLSLVETAKFDRDDVNLEDWEEHQVPNDEIGKTVEVFLIDFPENKTTNEVLLELDEIGFRPANLFELLALAKSFPLEQRKYPIVALGSSQYLGTTLPSRSTGIGVIVIKTDHFNSLRIVEEWTIEGDDISGFGTGWTTNYRFAAVRKD